MISGKVTNLHALMNITFRLANGSFQELPFVVDTGFTGFLTLPLRDAELLGLPFEYDQVANLADDSEILLPVHTGSIIWSGGELDVRVLVTGRRPLLGTALLSRCELTAEFVENGSVTIE